jgi:hypothetical protein
MPRRKRPEGETVYDTAAERARRPAQVREVLAAEEYASAAYAPQLDSVGQTLRYASYLNARRGFSTDAALADVFPVSPSRVTRWKQGHPPEAENARLLRDLGIVVSLLDGFVDEDAIHDWLHGTNAHLGNRRPVDVVRDGRLSEVVRALEAEKSGAFA